jgi:hypothetical protein
MYFTFFYSFYLDINVSIYLYIYTYIYMYAVESNQLKYQHFLSYLNFTYNWSMPVSFLAVQHIKEVKFTKQEF